ncbi:hypothetical protein Esti_005766 [Eimeria stiedai]
MPLIRAGADDNTAADTAATRPQFQVLKLLGQGTFGRVYLVRDLITADSIFYSTTPGGFTVQNILMEYMSSSLQAFLSKRRQDLRAAGKPPRSAPWIRHIASQIINGVHELHTRGVLHRDLKPENVLVFLCPHSPLSNRLSKQS